MCHTHGWPQQKKDYIQHSSFSSLQDQQDYEKADKNAYMTLAEALDNSCIDAGKNMLQV